MAVVIHPLVFAGVFMILLGITLSEFYRIVALAGYQPQRWFGLFSGMILFILTFLYLYLPVNHFIPIWILPVIFTLLLIQLFKKTNHPIADAAVTLLGLFYVALPITLTAGLVYPPATSTFSPQIILFLYMVIWINDTGAYLIGSLAGRHPLWKRISPAKTVEGVVAGVLLAYLAAFLTRSLFPELTFQMRLILTGVIILFGTLGDLLESMFKRRVQVKDSGKLIPGHGGLLDRLDSLLLAVPAVYFTLLIQQWL